MQTRRQELSDGFDKLNEDRKRLGIRNELKEHNKKLVAAAKDAGVETSLEYAVFQNHGYMGLYGGLGAKEIHRKKRLKKSQKILDHMGSTELAANLSPKEYVSGESFKYLGNQVRLKAVQSSMEGVKYYRGYLYLYVKNKDDYQHKKYLLDKWYREKAKMIFAGALHKNFLVLEKYGLKKPALMIRTMKTRWGSTVLDKNIILLNFELIKAAKYCIDYVVLHELIHFRFRNHNRDFYDFLAVLMPDWKTRKTILDEEVVREL